MIAFALAALLGAVAPTCVTPEDFGASGRGYPYDDREALTIAANYCVDSCVHLLPHPHGYYSSGPIVASTCSVTFMGENGFGRDYETSVRFPKGKPGLRFEGAGMWGASIGVAWMGTRSSSTAKNYNAHGIDIRSDAFLDRTFVADFDGDGIRYSCGLPTNCNASVVGSAWSETNGGIGFSTAGGDANSLSVTALSLVENEGGGLLDTAMLGNHFGTIHLDSGPYKNKFGIRVDNPNSATVIDFVYEEGGGNEKLYLSARAAINGGNIQGSATTGPGSYHAAGVFWGSQSFQNRLDPNRAAWFSLAGATHEPGCFFELSLQNATNSDIGKPIRLCMNAANNYTLGADGTGIEIGSGLGDLPLGRVALPQGYCLGGQNNRRCFGKSSTKPTTTCRGGDTVYNDDASPSNPCYAWACDGDRGKWRCIAFGP